MKTIIASLVLDAFLSFVAALCLITIVSQIAPGFSFLSLWIGCIGLRQLVGRVG